MIEARHPTSRDRSRSSAWWVGAAILTLAAAGCSEGSQQGSNYAEVPGTLPPTAPLPSDPPNSPPTSPPESPAGVLVRPGESIQAAVDANPPGTTYLIAAGVHLRQMVLPKDGDVFQGEPGAILDGEGVTPYAFDGSNEPVRVTIRGLVIQNYAPPLRDGVIRGNEGAEWSTDGWVIEDSEIRYNGVPEGGGMGIRLGDRMIVRGNNIHHNDQYGIGGSGEDVLIENNEIAYNNHRGLNDEGAISGGTKFIRTKRLVVRGNYVHHNRGSGIWTDIDNDDALIEDNRVEFNTEQGIFHEIGYSIVIRNNVVRQNGHERGRWAYGAGILIAHSTGAEVYGNLVENNYNGILGIQQNREHYRLDSLWVHNNTIVQVVGKWAAGVAPGDVIDPVFDRHLRFDANSYVLGPNARFIWHRSPRTYGEWLAFGMDRAGNLTQSGKQ